MRSSIKFLPNYQKRSVKDRSIPIYLRVIFETEKAESRLPFKFTDDELQFWNADLQLFNLKASSTKLKAINKLFLELREKFELMQIDLEKRDAKTILDTLLNRKEVQVITILSFVNEYYQRQIVELETIRMGTKQNYRKALRHITKFMKLEKKEELPITSLNGQFVSDFYHFLLSKKPEIAKEAMVESSAAGIIKKFRTIFNTAVDKELIGSNPFLRIKLKTQSPAKKPLSIPEIKKLYQKDFSYSESLETCRDLFLFSILTGLAFVDNASLKAENLEWREDGSVKLTKNRTKTDCGTESFLVEPAIELLKKFKERPDCVVAGRVIPKRSNQKLNLYLKDIASVLGINTLLSTHIARHTFRQLLAEADITDSKTINRMMGHSAYGSTNSAYGIVTDGMLLKSKAKLDEYLRLNILEA